MAHWMQAMMMMMTFMLLFSISAAMPSVVRRSSIMKSNQEEMALASTLLAAQSSMSKEMGELRERSSDEHLPRLIHQSHKLPFDELPGGMKNAMQGWKQVNPNWEHKYYSDSDLDRMVAESNDEAVQKAFGKLKDYLPHVGAARADLMRYYIIYHQGGAWADSDTEARKGLDTKVNVFEDDYVTSLGPLDGTSSDGKEIMGPHQWLIVAAPGHPVMRAALEKTIQNIMAWNTSIEGLGGPGNNIEGLGGPPVLHQAMLEVLGMKDLTAGVHYCSGTTSKVRLLPGREGLLGKILGLEGTVFFKYKGYEGDLNTMNISYWPKSEALASTLRLLGRLEAMPEAMRLEAINEAFINQGHSLQALLEKQQPIDTIAVEVSAAGRIQNGTYQDDSQVPSFGPMHTFSEAVAYFDRAGSDAPVAFSRGKDVHQTLDLIAIIYICGRKDYQEALWNAVLRYAPKSAIYELQGKQPMSFVLALEFGMQKFPDAKWFYIADDDSFVHLTRLASMAWERGHLGEEQHFFGLQHGVRGRVCGSRSFECRESTMSDCDGPGWACGGPGVLISYTLASSMKSRGCPDYYKDHWPYADQGHPDAASDVALACCVRDAMGDKYHVDDVPGFEYDQFGNHMGDRYGQYQPQDAIAIHHISRETVEELGERYNKYLLEQ